jgi:hypothetical protein
MERRRLALFHASKHFLSSFNSNEWDAWFSGVMTNEEFFTIKERFLNKYDTGAKRFYWFILKKVSETEQILNKDIFLFSMEELDSCLCSLSNGSKQMVSSNASCLRQYIAFAIEEGYVRDGINLLDTIIGKDLNKYVDKNAAERKYITFEQLQEMQSQCINDQDLVIPELLFVGVKGENSNEIINLKVQDIIGIKTELGNGEYKINYKIILSNREIPITLRTYEIIQNAISQTDYYRGNGEDIGGAKTKTFPINDSEYVVRTSGTKKNGTIGYNTLVARVNRIKAYFGNPYLNITNLWVSGMIHMAKGIKEEKGELTK